MTDPVTITIGVPGQSDVVLVELENAARQLNMTVETVWAYLIGIGLGDLEEQGIITRATIPGRGLDPEPLADDAHPSD